MAQHAELTRKRFDPTRIFVEKDRLTWFWFGFAMLVLAGSAIDRIYLVQSFKQRERVVVIDPANTFYVSPLLKFSEAKESARGTKHAGGHRLFAAQSGRIRQ